MKRKGYNEKRETIIRAANNLFLKKGYEKTSVDEILLKISISKGTFYHYFKSKIELLNVILQEFSLAFVNKLKPFIEDKSLNPLKKLNAYFELNQTMKSTNKNLFIDTINNFNKDENFIYYKKLNANLTNLLVPQMIKILQYGRDEKIFQVENIDENALLIINLGFTLRNTIIIELFKGQKNISSMTSLKKIEAHVDTYRICFEKMLGLKKKSLILFKKGYFQQFLVKPKKK
jgi:AcrR family transcriptional regulator